MAFLLRDLLLSEITGLEYTTALGLTLEQLDDVSNYNNTHLKFISIPLTNPTSIDKFTNIIRHDLTQQPFLSRDQRMPLHRHAHQLQTRGSGRRIPCIAAGKEKRHLAVLAEEVRAIFHAALHAVLRYGKLLAWGSMEGGRGGYS